MSHDVNVYCSVNNNLASFPETLCWLMRVILLLCLKVDSN